MTTTTTTTNDKKYCYAYEEDGSYFQDDGKDPEYCWRGEVKRHTHADLFYFDEYGFMEALGESVLEECGEVAEIYIPQLTTDQFKALHDAVKKAVLGWMDENIPQPTFFTAENVLPIQELIK